MGALWALRLSRGYHEAARSQAQDVLKSAPES